MSASLYGGITQGITKSGIKVVIYGQEKMGKTTLVCGSPTPLLVPLERGFNNVTCNKTPLVENYVDFLNFLNETEQYVKTGQFPFKSLVFDSVTALERLINDYTIALDPVSKGGKTNTMETAHGGYAKAYSVAFNVFNDMLKKLDMLALMGINIVFTGHGSSFEITDPTVGRFLSWDMMLHSPKKNGAYGKKELFAQWVNLTGFLSEPLFLTTDKETGATLGISQQKGRILGCTRKPSYAAGNHLGIQQDEIPIPCPPENGWNHLAQAIYTSSGIDVFTR
jgi:hypothetical protein